MASQTLFLRVGLSQILRGRGNSGAVQRYCSSVVPPRPSLQIPAGVAIVSVFSVPFISLGAYAAKMFASGLEDFDLFVPDDDDD